MSKSEIVQFEKRALRVNEAVQSYGLSRSTLYRLIAGGVLHSVRVGGRRLIPVDALEALLTGEWTNSPLVSDRANTDDKAGEPSAGPKARGLRAAKSAPFTGSDAANLNTVFMERKRE